MRTAVVALVTLIGATIFAALPDDIVITRVFPLPGQLELFVANADGTDEHPLLQDRNMDYDAAWSPDGRSIVFTSERNGSAELYRVKPDGTALERLTDNPAYDDQAAFSPDGSRLVFVTTRAGGTADLWTMDVQSRRAKPLTSGPGGDFRPSWSPDGKWIAFSSDRESNLPSAHGRWEHLQLAEIYLVHPDGSGLKRLTPHGDFCGSPKWAADSQRVIAYCMTAEQTLENRRAVPEQKDPTRLTWIDIATGRTSDAVPGPGLKFNPSVLPGDVVGYVRKAIDTTVVDNNNVPAGQPGRESGAGIYYSNGARGPKGDVRTASWSPDGKRVVFHKRVTAARKPWMPAWSRNPSYRLTMSFGGPSFSPAGDRFVFVGPPAGSGQLSTLVGGPVGAGVAVAETGADKYNVIYADKTRNVLGPQWSPSGDAIVFGIGTYNAFFNGFHGVFLKPEDRVEGGAQIAMVKPDGTGFRELTTGPNNNSFPSMAPDGVRLVFRTFGSDGEGLRILDLKTGKVSPLTTGYDNFPLWSPRGDLIMFSRQADGDYEIYTITPDGKTTRRLTSSRGNDAHMAWSPDGERIAFASTRMGFKDEAIYTDAPQPYGEIFVMRYDGTHVEQLTDNQWEEGTPAWQPSPGLRAHR
jgi:Tol biopolymer transport system component